MEAKESENSSSSYETYSISEEEEVLIDFDVIDFFIATRIPAETYRFKWNVNLFCKLSTNKELYSPYICELNQFSCRLKLVKYENGFGLFHVYQTRKKEATIPQAIEYQVSIVDRLGRARIKWAVSFSITDDYECCKIGEYRSNSWKTFPSDVVDLHCCLKVIKTPVTEKQLVNTEYSFEYPARQKLSEDLKFMYENSLNADCTLEIGTERIRVNSSILAARSPVFKKILHHDTEKNTFHSVPIEGVQLPTLKRLLMFLYTGRIEEVAVDLTLEEVSELYSAAIKYEVNDLRKMCIATLLSMVSVDNVTSVLMLANLHEDQDLKLAIANFIRLNYDIIVGSDTWRSFMDNESKMAYQILSFCAHKLNLNTGV
ncbi:speckle-type POZ protein B [Trichonephila inaurata madagascariensis]|uniref:Speckle-type POZ protein B n=1 Tax=Trichonephila inaurata madagascariensis TaxID=2747483 RepID=A0A8X6Y365_9ARAC|nr:speckle-type POZ protein B [Trichonephila inaurata madagascariensis]